MAESVASVLLKITGDASSARDELLTLSKQVEQFDSQDATATADVDTAQGERKLKDLFGEVARWARERASAKIDADTSDAVAGIDRVQAKADVLDAKHVDVEVDVDTDRADRGVSGFLRKLGGLFRTAGKVNSELGQLSQAGFGAVTGSAGAASGAVDNFSGSVGTGGIAMRIAGVAAAGLAAVIGPVMVAAIGSAIVAIGALVASLTVAAGALGVFAAGFVSVLAPAVALGVGVVERFKATADVAGSAANRLKTAFEGFRDVFAKVVAPGADAVFRGVAAALQSLTPVLRGLGPGFTAFGKAVGGALAALGREFARPVWTRFFKQLLGAATQVVGPITDLFVGLARVFRNIATVALPLLAGGIRKVADGLKGFSRGAGSMESIQRFLAAAIPHLRSWLSLIGAVAEVFLGFVRAAAPAGKELVDWLGEGARNIAEWVNSAKGQEQIKQFFKDTLPLVKSTVELFARLALLAITAFQAIAPALQGVISQMSFWVGLIQKAVNWFNTLSPTLRGILFPLNGLAAAFGYLSTAVGTVIPGVKDLASGIADGLSGVVSDAVGVVKDLVSAVVGGIRSGVGKATAAAAAVAGGIRDGIASVAAAIRDTVRGIALRVIEIVRSFVDNGRAAGAAVFTAVRNGIASVAEAVRSAARSILQRVIEIVRGFTDNARNAGTAVFNAVRNGIASVADNIREAARSILGRVIEIVRSFTDNARNAGEAVMGAVRNGIASVADNVREAVHSIVERAVGVVLSLATSFFNAGKALVSALANGIAAGAGEALSRLRDLANKLRSFLPGSEPKDRTSPLRGLQDAGAAIVSNIAAGIAKAGPLALGQLSGQLAATVIAPQAMPAPGGGLGDLSAALRSMPTGSNVGPTINLHVPTVVPTDSASLAMLADVLTDALSRQGYRGAKVQVVR